MSEKPKSAVARIGASFKKKMADMNVKFKRAMTLIISLFLGGNWLIYLGIVHGRDWASTLSRPWGATSWTTEGSLIDALTYVPVIMGGVLIALAFVMAVVVFCDWYRKSE